MVPEFKVGDLVRVRQSGRGPAPGIHEVVGVEPARGSNERVYRVRSARAATERTVSERHVCRA